ncbi:hypothetical protein RchiOBHm_Chr6g0253121 [Rosa chinensis]|uniref:Uncharacterized protein n=1 Tax=Rosa chinensis TaxID=74649 RepID=A0A2P6PLB0_ROSCH|nr:hypothetical protein RchiOBHm_Chr6g0253121 [Rosa chinensis]
MLPKAISPIMGSLNPTRLRPKTKIGFTKNKIGRSSTKPGADSKQKSVHTVTKN